MENEGSVDSAFEKSLLEIFNYHYDASELQNWLIQFSEHIKPFEYLESDLSRAIHQDVPDYDEVIRLLAKHKNLSTDSARFIFMRCLQCNSPVGIPSLGSFRSYGEYIAVASRGFYFLYTHAFNENETIWKLVEQLVEKYLAIPADKKSNAMLHVIEKLIDPFYNQQMHLSDHSDYRYCPKCGGNNFSDVERDDVGITICATYKSFNLLEPVKQIEIVHQHLKTFR